MANDDNYCVGIVKEWKAVSGGYGYGQILYVDSILGEEANIAVLEEAVAMECRPLMKPDLEVTFKPDESDWFHNITLVSFCIRRAQIYLGNRFKDFPETWHEVGGQLIKVEK